MDDIKELIKQVADEGKHYDSEMYVLNRKELMRLIELVEEAQGLKFKTKLSNYE